MPGNAREQRQTAGLVSRLFSLEAVLLVAGLVSLGHGLLNQVHMNTFFGLVIIPGVFVLHKVRKKDWQAHWEEMAEAQRRERERKGDGN